MEKLINKMSNTGATEIHRPLDDRQQNAKSRKNNDDMGFGVAGL